MGDFFEKRESDSKVRINGLRSELATSIGKVIAIDHRPEICIYASGLLARYEASEHSDLDAFFFLSGCKNDTPLSRVADVQILNAIISAASANKFPDFSNDGEYLQFMHIDDVINDIGGREDDYHNALTARMLLILESKWLYNDKLFEKFRYDVIERYFKDFHKHANDFKPIFLLNDILRFWRTLCLNYENGRHWRKDDSRERAKGHLANLKLRFSRLNICFSFVAMLLLHSDGVFPKKLIDIADMTPIERLSALADVATLAADAKMAISEYEWFLSSLDGPKNQVLDWIGDKDVRIEAFDHSDRFVNSMYNILRAIAEDKNYMRYLVI
jgi:hypothetical protein